jgi:hypothetical protein
MILFSLRCSHGHGFEAWFSGNAAYEAQAASGAIICPFCDDVRIEKAPMAPRIGKSVRAEEGRALTPLAEGSPPDGDAPQAEMMRHLRALRVAVEKGADYVGPTFAEEARKIHYGEAPERAIYGEATPQQRESLHEEGIAVAAIPWVNLTH